MASLVSDQEKADWAGEFKNIHDTFARSVVVYKSPDRIDVVVNNNDFIPMYRKSKQGAGLSYDLTPVSGEFKMRVKWLNPDKEGANLPIDVIYPGHICRLKMEKEAFDFVSDCKTVFVDGYSCEVIGAFTPKGLFGIDFYTLYVQRRDMK
jgi:hypothetical protein